MLQIKNVTKRYVTKGVTVNALDGVSVTFPERGMVFLLGKSGSGKSTLLNVSGGLDMPDSGEIVLKGRSSKDFSQSDFDSYRNTFVGFIFQEYNVLDEFTLEENIAIALELQGKPNDHEKVSALLKDVGLEGLGKRRPNTLSGGQKQRVAIARALVKNPEIIMADEPTGALDSATGKQVFDTLKNLSKDKLVIVVSHDREFAEVYADRIIELKDGKIVSDRTKFYQDGENTASAADNLSFYGERTLSVEDFSKLTVDDFLRIKEFFKNKEGSVLITSNEAQVQTVKKSEGVNDDGVKGTFKATDTSAYDENKYDGSEVKFIKSKLPVRHAVKMGTSSLRIKPFKLAFTAILSTVAFIIFGILSTLLTYNDINVTVNAISEKGYQSASLSKYAEFEYQQTLTGSSWYESKTIDVRYNEEELKNMSDANSGVEFIGVYNYNTTSTQYSLTSLLSDYSDFTLTYFYANNLYVKGFADLSNKELSKYGLSLVAGSYPVTETEVAIPLYVFELFQKAGVYVEDLENAYGVSVIYPENYEDIIGKTVFLKASGDERFVLNISGIIDCGVILDEYELLKKVRSLSVFDTTLKELGVDARYVRALASDFNNFYDNSFNSVFFVSDKFYAHNKNIAFRSSIDFASRARSAIGMAYDPKEVKVITRAEFENKTPELEGLYRLIVTDYTETEKDIYQYAYAYIGANVEGRSRYILNNLLDGFEGDINYVLSYTIIDEVKDATEVVEILERIFMIAGIALALFAALLLSNFIAVSINNKEKDIGILRAVGARGTDIFKIFISEALVITMICFLLASVGTAVICALVNDYMITNAIVAFSILLFGVPDILIIFLIALVTALVATSLPVIKTVRKKPVEAIRCL